MESFLEDFEGTLKTLDRDSSAKKFLTRSTAAGALVSLSLLAAALFYFQDDSLALPALAAFFLPGILDYFFALYRFEERKKSIEDEIPDLLLIASSLPEKTDFSRLVEFMAENSSKELSQEFLAAKKSVENGAPVESALLEMKKRNRSLALNRALDMITNALHTGANMKTIFRETAHDFMETNSILRERSANTTVEKYTLLLAGGIIVPLILGLLAGMVSGFNFSTVSELGIGLSEEQRLEIIEASLLGNIIYILEYAVIASAFVAFQEGNQKKTVLYASILVPVGALVYFLAKGF